ncbi:hypothetical protein VTI74DRAFT_4775 [Chaetomium olivicolor]
MNIASVTRQKLEGAKIRRIAADGALPLNTRWEVTAFHRGSHCSQPKTAPCPSQHPLHKQVRTVLSVRPPTHPASPSIRHQISPSSSSFLTGLFLSRSYKLYSPSMLLLGMDRQVHRPVMSRLVAMTAVRMAVTCTSRNSRVRAITTGRCRRVVAGRRLLAAAVPKLCQLFWWLPVVPACCCGWLRLFM